MVSRAFQPSVFRHVKDAREPCITAGHGPDDAWPRRRTTGMDCAGPYGVRRLAAAARYGHGTGGGTDGPMPGQKSSHACFRCSLPSRPATGSSPRRGAAAGVAESRPAASWTTPARRTLAERRIRRGHHACDAGRRQRSTGAVRAPVRRFQRVFAGHESKVAAAGWPAAGWMLPPETSWACPKGGWEYAEGDA